MHIKTICAGLFLTLGAACQISGPSASGLKVQPITTANAFVETYKSVCDAHVGSLPALRAELTSRGYRPMGRDAVTTLYGLSNNQPTVSIGRGAKGTNICMVLAQNTSGFEAAVRDTITAQSGYTYDGSFVAGPNSIGVTMNDTKPEGPIFGIAATPRN